MPRSRSADSSAVTGDVEGEAGGERAILRHHEGDHGGDLVRGDEPAARDAGQHVGDMLLGHLIQNPGLGGGRGDSVDGDVVLGDFLGERLGERDDAGLGGGVGRGGRVAFLAGDRGDVGDASVILLDHSGDDGPAADELAAQIDADDAVPFLDRILGDLSVQTRDAGIVD